MKKPFIISFTKEIENSSSEAFINLFLINLKRTHYKKVRIIDNSKIIITGDFYSLNPAKGVPWNLWTGFSKKAIINIDNGSATYSIDISYGLITVLLSLLFFLIPRLIFSANFDIFYLYFLSFAFAVQIMAWVLESINIGAYSLKLVDLKIDMLEIITGIKYLKKKQTKN